MNVSNCTYLVHRSLAFCSSPSQLFIELHRIPMKAIGLIWSFDLIHQKGVCCVIDRWNGYYTGVIIIVIIIIIIMIVVIVVVSTSILIVMCVTANNIKLILFVLKVSWLCVCVNQQCP